MRILTSLLLAASLTRVAAQTESISFSRDIAPILIDQCQTCHGPSKERGRYRVDSFASLITPGASDLPTITPHSPDESELYARLIAADDEDRMPADSDPLPAEAIRLFRQWIEEGAAFDAEDPNTDLLSIIPSKDHQSAPDAYSHPVPITALAFNHDGSELLVGGYHEILVWDNLPSPRLARRIGNQGERTYAITLHPHGRWLASASGAPGRIGEVRLFDIFTGELLDVLEKTPDVSLTTSFSPDGTHLATGSSDGNLRVYNVPAFEQVNLITGHSNWVNHIAWNLDGTRIASASRDKTAKVFSLAGERLITFPGHASSVQSVAFEPNSLHLISSGTDRRTIRWRFEDAENLGTLVKHAGTVNAMTLHENRIFLGGSDGKARQYDPDGKLIHQFSHPSQRSVLSLAWSPARAILALGSMDGRITLWNVEENKIQSTFLAFPCADLE